MIRDILNNFGDDMRLFDEKTLYPMMNTVDIILSSQSMYTILLCLYTTIDIFMIFVIMQLN